MRQSILSQDDLDDVARACADQDRRDCAIVWRCIFAVAAFDLAISIYAVARWWI
jgi:hypothetical protein